MAYLVPSHGGTGTSHLGIFGAYACDSGPSKSRDEGGPGGTTLAARGSRAGPPVASARAGRARRGSRRPRAVGLARRRAAPPAPCAVGRESMVPGSGAQPCGATSTAGLAACGRGLQVCPRAPTSSAPAAWVGARSAIGLAACGRGLQERPRELPRRVLRRRSCCMWAWARAQGTLARSRATRTETGWDKERRRKHIFF